jgi:formylglycine-generating enzyme required for sulfatase activity
MRFRYFILIMFFAVMAELSALKPMLSVSGTKGSEGSITLAVPQIARTGAGQANAGTGVPVKVKENSKDGLKYVWIPPGNFVMGCSTGDNECFAQEKPAHPVKITKGFWIGQTEVTVAAYQLYVNATRNTMPAPPMFNRGWSHEQMPIVNIRWDDAKAYCTWVGGRLPTEAEWEYAARAGSTEPTYGEINQVAWYYVNSDGQAHEVGAKQPNEFGLYDMLGNEWEWVNDWYDVDYYTQSPPQDPPGPSTGVQHVLRGGSWAGYSQYTRVSVRIRGFTGDGKGFNGFRCAM